MGSDDRLSMRFVFSGGERELFRAVAKYYGVTMHDLLREYLLDEGRNIMGPLVAVTTDEGKEVSTPLVLQPNELASFIFNKLDQEKKLQKEAIEKSRVELERIRTKARERRESRIAVPA